MVAASTEGDGQTGTNVKARHVNKCKSVATKTVMDGVIAPARPPLAAISTTTWINKKKSVTDKADCQPRKIPTSDSEAMTSSTLLNCSIVDWSIRSASIRLGFKVAHELSNPHAAPAVKPYASVMSWVVDPRAMSIRWWVSMCHEINIILGQTNGNPKPKISPQKNTFLGTCKRSERMSEKVNKRQMRTK